MVNGGQIVRVWAISRKHGGPAYVRASRTLARIARLRVHASLAVNDPFQELGLSAS